MHEDVVLPECMHALLLSVLLRSERRHTGMNVGLFEWHDIFCYGLIPFGTGD
jgi:hypothetical protein